ncbi:uncharacterized protein [Pyrus communis]|uniref:uncharacterized protein n=1 Tax=Pyrus communis TaxID=23211 RepID=UPI0035C18805
MKEELLIQNFYEGLLPMERQMLDASAGGALVDKTPGDAEVLIANRAHNAQQYEGVGQRDPPRPQVNEEVQTQNKERQIQDKRVDNLEKQMGQIAEFMGQIREQGRLPSSTVMNPKGGFETAKAIMLRSDLRSTGVSLEAEDQEVALLANFQVRPILINRALEAHMADEETQEIIQARNQGKRKDLRVCESDDMLMQESRMFVPNNLDLKKAILDEAYISIYAMHPGATKMYHTIRPFYYWPGMKRERAKYVSRCAVCQQIKAEKKKPFRLLQPLPVPEWKWENITMDFVYKLPRTHNGLDGIWVIVDRLTKSVHFILVREKYYLGRLAELFISMIVKYHGVPFGDAWHKRGRGKSLVGPEIVEETTQNVQVIKSNLKAAQYRQKSLRDYHVTDGAYEVGDWVFLKLSPWRGVLLFRKKGKLSPRYIRPYMITEGVGEVAYRLELPSKLAKVHNVFHLSMLRHYVTNPSHVIPPQPLEMNPNLTYDKEPVTILDWKEKVLGNKTVNLVKVLWWNHSADEATWETEDRMRDLYPRLFFDR